MKLTMLGLKFNPQLVVSDVGSDPITLAGLLASFAKNKTAGFGNSLTQGIITDGYLPSTGETTNSWIALFSKIHAQYLTKLPLDGNVLYGLAVGYTFVQAMFKAGKNPTRQDLIDAINAGLPQDAVGRAVRLLSHRPQRRHRRLHGRDQERRCSCRPAASSSPTTRRPAPITRSQAPAAERSGKRHPVAVACALGAAWFRRPSQASRASRHPYWLSP